MENGMDPFHCTSGARFVVSMHELQQTCERRKCLCRFLDKPVSRPNLDFSAKTEQPNKASGCQVLLYNICSIFKRSHRRRTGMSQICTKGHRMNWDCLNVSCFGRFIPVSVADGALPRHFCHSHAAVDADSVTASAADGARVAELSQWPLAAGARPLAVILGVALCASPSKLLELEFHPPALAKPPLLEMKQVSFKFVAKEGHQVHQLQPL